MKRALTLAFVVALPLAAEEPKSANTTTASSTTTATAAPAAQPDSPLVAAAKRANRKGKKSTAILITNDTLKTSGANAHVTTTTSQNAIQMPKPLDPPRPTPEMAHQRAVEAKRKLEAEEAEKQRLAKAAQEQKALEAAAAAEEGYDGTQDDASEFVGAEPPPPQF
jgi:hypothetical protein